MAEFNKMDIPVEIDGVKLKLSSISRDGTKEPILFLHGFGSTKEDYADIIRQHDLKDHPFLAYDAPACGETICIDPKKVSIPFLVKTAIAALDYVNFDQFHIVGHSMGGLTALMLANQFPDRILSFIDIEGNISPEDCFLSRQIVDYPAENASDFFESFIERTLYSPAFSSPLYSARLRHNINYEAVPSIFSSMVELSDNAQLMDKFLNLPCPKMFMYGEQNNSLSYLDHIKSKGVRLSEIPNCGHFPMYSNPPMMWKDITDFYSKL